MRKKSAERLTDSAKVILASQTLNGLGNLVEADRRNKTACFFPSANQRDKMRLAEQL
jgi:hypothetical protein